MTKEYGEFSFPIQPNHKHGNIWCNWIIWAGPRRHVIVNITGFVSKEDCATNQDAILFYGIASTVESTVIHACSNQTIHLFATRAVAVHVVYLSRSSGKTKAETSFHGAYYTFEDFEKMRLKYPSRFLVKELGWQNFSVPSKRLTNDPTLSVATVPIKVQDTGGTKAVAPNHYNSDLLIHKLRSTKIAKSSTVATSNKGNQIPFEMSTTHVTESDFYLSALEHAMSSTITSRIGLSTSTVQNEKQDGSADAHTSSKNDVGRVTWSNMLSLLHGVKPTAVAAAFHQGFSSNSTATGNEVLTFDILLQDNITMHNERTEKSFRLSTGLDKKYDLIYTSQSKVAFLKESNMEKPVPTRPLARSEVSSHTVSTYLQAGGSVKDGKWYGTKSRDDRGSTKDAHRNDLLLSSIAPNSMSEEKSTGHRTRTFSRHLGMFPLKISPQLFLTQEKWHTTLESDHNTPYSHSAQGGVQVSPLKHKYGLNIRDRHENSVFVRSEAIDKLVPKLGKNRRKIRLHKDGRKSRRKNGRKNIELRGKKNEAAPPAIEYSKVNSTLNSPLRVVKALRTPTSEAIQTLVGPPPQVSQRHPPLQGAEAVKVLIGSDHEVGDRMAGVHATSTIHYQEMSTVDGRHHDDPFDRVALAVALEKNHGLKSRHNPGDTLFALAIAIEHRGKLQNEAQVQEQNMLHSIKEKIKEKMHHSSSHLNEIKLQHFQRTRAYNAVLTLWIHLRPGGKNLHYYKSQLKTLGDVSSVNGKFALVSLSVEDVDECASGIQLCGEAADCANEMGTYACKCKDGYEVPSAETLGTTCVLSQPAGLAFPFNHVEILMGASLGFVLLLLLAVVVLCVFVKKRPVKRTVYLDGTSPATKNATVQSGTTQPSIGHTSTDSAHVTCRKFPVVQRADGREHASGQSCSLHLAKVTLEQSPCL